MDRWIAGSWRAGGVTARVTDAADDLDLDITPRNIHDTAASPAIQAGASVTAVARLLVHESAATTLDHCAGLFPGDVDEVAKRLDAAARQTIARQTTPSNLMPQNHRPSTDQGGVKWSRAAAQKPSLNCKQAWCPRQDSNLRHRLLQRKHSIRACSPPKAPSCQPLSFIELSVTSRYFPRIFVINDE
jgi:hypothetical protein